MRSQQNMNWIAYHLKLPFNKELQEFGKKKNGSFYKKTWDFKSSENKNIFTQDVYLIQSKITYSAAVEMSSFIKTYNIGTIIGEETGGHTSGYIDAVTYTLPNSKLQFVCSTQYFENEGSKGDGKGVLPDIEYKIEDPNKSFTLKQLKEMLQLVEKYKSQRKNDL